MNLFRRMLREEWRRHARLFGPRRFAAFPLGVAAVAAVTYWFLTLGDTSLAAIAGGLHGLVFLFGLHVGTVGFVGRDALENLLGDVTLLVFSARTLPISRSKLLGTFLVKDLCYYAVLYVAPLVVGFAPFGLAAGFSPLELVALWLTVAASFTLGVSLSVLLAAVYTRSRTALPVVAAAFGGIVWWLGDAALRMTPLAVHRDPTFANAAASLGTIAVLAALGLWLFRPTALDGHRTTTDRFETVRSRIPGEDDALVTWTLFDVVRSSGSVWKVAFSAGVLFAVAAFLVDEVATLTGVRPSPGITFGALLGIGSFTTYSWITQFDDPETYLLYPLDLPAVVRAKFVAYLLLNVPISAAFLLVAAALFGSATLLSGAFVLVCMSVYVFGLTAHVAGLSPNELLFDTPRFLRYGAGLVGVGVPLLVLALAHAQWPAIATAGAVGLSLVAAVAGVALYRRAGPAWDARVRDVTAR